MGRRIAQSRWVWVAAIVPFLAGSVWGHPLEEWTVRHSSSNSFVGVTYGGGQFVAVGQNGAIATSPTGRDWIDQPSGTTAALLDVAYGNNAYVAVGYDGTVLRSTNGTAWAPEVSGTSQRLDQVAFENGVFVSLGYPGVVIRSTNGASWSISSPSGPFRSIDLGYGNNSFILKTSSAATNWVSADGLNWFLQETGLDDSWYILRYGGDRFLLIDIRRRVFASATGSNWTEIGTCSQVRHTDLVYGNGYWVSCGPLPLEYSHGGAVWHPVTQTGAATDLAFGNGYFVATGSSIRQSGPLVNLSFRAPDTVELQGIAGVVYTLQSADALDPNMNWTSRTNIPSIGPDVTWTDPDYPESSVRLYRALFTPP